MLAANPSKQGWPALYKHASAWADFARAQPVPQHPAPLLPAGLPCDFEHSLCRGRNEMCIGRGPAFPDYFKSNEIIATRQADKAQELLQAASEELTGANLLAGLPVHDVPQQHLVRGGCAC